MVVGENGSGKTSLFESIYLAAAGHPLNALRVRGWRGLGEIISLTVARREYEGIWRDFFHGLNHHNPIEIELRGSAENSRTLKIYYSSEGEQVTLALGSGAQDSTIIVPIVFEYNASPNRASDKFIVELGPEGLVIKGPAQAMRLSYFAAAGRPSPQETARRYSDLSKKKAEAKFMKLFQTIYPEIKSLSVEVTGNISLLYGEADCLPEKVPLTVISDGAYRLASYLLGIADTERGVVLIDEIENGFYYKLMPDIWRALRIFADKYETQLFASTHSEDCLEAAAEAAEDHEYAYSLLRVEQKGGESLIKQFGGRTFRNAMNQQIEVR